MEIRLLNANEVQWAVGTANEVFENCVRESVRSAEEIRQYDRYMNPERLTQELTRGELILWGAFEEGIMVAVSAMTRNGHITMLYVKPQFGHRKIGFMLVDHMRMFASAVLHLNQVTVNVVPAVAAPFFCRVGFYVLPYRNPDVPYVPLACHIFDANGENGCAQMPQKTWNPKVTYPKKKVSGKTVLIVTAVTLILCIGICAGITIGGLL